MKDTCIASINPADYSEKVNYNHKEYPAHICKERLSHYPNYSAVSHWHEDLEFIVILSGHMLYHVNGKTIMLSEGDGILINSRQFHYGSSPDHTECEFLCILFHPLLLCVNSYFESCFVHPIISNTKQPYLLLRQDALWHRQILDNLKSVYECSGQPDGLLQIQQQLLTLWIPLYQNFPRCQDQPARPNRQLTTVKNMIAFVQKHYQEPLSLNQIADSGNVCKSCCLALFRKYLSQTPIAYLTGYRLSQSAKLLTETDMSILEISYEAGFHNASYYSETFKKYYGCTPKEYRKNH